ncbi:MAG: cupin domain-containing protein [Planctomycetota bacterium]|nr:cupin domain-containing protein [Planctomycetota bacterium]
MNNAMAMVRAPGEGPTLSVVGETIRVLADSAMTGGACAMIEETGPFGAGPPLHRHTREDEHFYVLEGQYKFTVNGQESMVSAGGYAFAPRGSVHTFVNATPPPGRARLLVVCTPGGLESAFRECDELARRGPVSMDAIVAAFGKIGVEFLGPPLAV